MFLGKPKTHTLSFYSLLSPRTSYARRMLTRTMHTLLSWWRLQRRYGGLQKRGWASREGRQPQQGNPWEHKNFALDRTFRAQQGGPPLCHLLLHAQRLCQFALGRPSLCTLVLYRNLSLQLLGFKLKLHHEGFLIIWEVGMVRLIDLGVIHNMVCICKCPYTFSMYWNSF